MSVSYTHLGDVTPVADALRTAVKGLKEKGDKRELQKLVELVQGRLEKDYTPESFKVFDSALKSARDADKGMVEEAYTSLYNADQALVAAGGDIKPPADPVKVSEIRLNKTSERLFLKDTVKLTAAVRPADAKDCLLYTSRCV